jgi:hypothetical protein
MSYRGIEWLPELLVFDDFWKSLSENIEYLYSIFLEDFVNQRLNYNGLELGLKRHPLKEGKEATFWHLITKGDIEDEREMDIERCIRIKWPRPVIINHDDQKVKVWENVRRRNEKRIILWLDEVDYLVVLAKRKDKNTGKEYILPWTAYPVTKNHYKRKLKKEYEDYHKKG